MPRGTKELFEKICRLIGYYAGLNGTSITTFQDNVSVPSSRVMGQGYEKCQGNRCFDRGSNRTFSIHKSKSLPPKPASQYFLILRSLLSLKSVSKN
jgi:hypothetical protein